ncbi:MAG TPA: tyrosine-protein phosphatase [Phycisphaerae bacterium]|nr:tyrosine-protein phosphatase [Phycisphaerae bacterium]
MSSPEDSVSVRNRTRGRVAIATLVIGLAVVGGSLYSRYYGEPKRFAVVHEGILYRSAQPKRGEIRHLAKEHHIKTIVIAREGTSRNVPDERETAEASGVQVVNIPIESRQPVPDEQIAAFFKTVDDPANQPVLVHCSAGRHRTGLLCALYRIERQGWSVERAMEEMLSFGFDRETQTIVERQLTDYQPGRFSRKVSATSASKVGGDAP